MSLWSCFWSDRSLAWGCLGLFVCWLLPSGPFTKGRSTEGMWVTWVDTTPRPGSKVGSWYPYAGGLQLIIFISFMKVFRTARCLTSSFPRDALQGALSTRSHSPEVYQPWTSILSESNGGEHATCINENQGKLLHVPGEIPAGSLVLNILRISVLTSD